MNKDCKNCLHNGKQCRYPSACTGCGAFNEFKNYEPTIEHFVSEAVRLHSFAHPDGQRYINAGDLVMMVSDMKIAKEC